MIAFSKATTESPTRGGRIIEHLLIDGAVFSYWIDHPAKLVMIMEIEDAE